MAKARSTSARKFVESVLHADAKHAPAIARVLKKESVGAAVRDGVLAALGDAVAAAKPPRWVVVEDGDIGQVIRLDAPVFTATAADGDEFFHEFPKARLVWKKGKKATRFARNDDGEGAAVTVGDRDVAKIDSYETDSDVVLTDIRWVDRPPKTLKELGTLLKKAADALFGEMDGYDAKDFAAASAAVAAPVSAGGPTGDYLGGPERTACYEAAGPVSMPTIAWRKEWLGDGGEWGGNAIVAGDVIYAGGGNRESTHVVALDAKGTVRWKWQPPNATTYLTTELAAARGLVFAGTAHGYFAIDAASGATRWKAGLTKLKRGGAVVVGDLVYVLTDRGFFGLSLENGRKKFSFPLTKGASGSPAFRDGLLYIAGDAKVFAIDVATGKAAWTAPGQEYAVSPAGPSLYEDHVLFVTNREIVAADARSGKTAWKKELSGDESLGHGTLAVGAGRIVFGDSAGAITALEAKDGRSAWRYTPKGMYGIGTGSPIIAGNMVYGVSVVGEINTHTSLVGLDLASGKERWRFDKVAKDVPLSWYSTPALIDGMLLVSAYGLAALR